MPDVVVLQSWVLMCRARLVWCVSGGGFNHCQTINKLLEATAMVCKRLASQGGVVGFVPLNEGVEQVSRGRSIWPRRSSHQNRVSHRC